MIVEEALELGILYWYAILVVGDSSILISFGLQIKGDYRFL
jgi:hypothetical protein